MTRDWELPADESESLWAENVRRRLYPEIGFGGHSRRDGSVAFWTRINCMVQSGMRVLDFGCGRGANASWEALPTGWLRQLRGRAGEVIGTDVDVAAASNPRVDRFVPIVDGRVMLGDGTVDLLICEWGLEHFERPNIFFSQAERLVREGGAVCIRTPNWLHCSSLGAKLVPFRWHGALRRLLGQQHGADDVFPVHYNCNSRRKLLRALDASGFDAVVHAHRGESHLSGTGIFLAIAGEVIERAAPPLLWHELHAFGRRRSAAARVGSGFQLGADRG